MALGMRITLILTFVITCSTLLHGQVASSLGSGNWNTPGTWSCACVPTNANTTSITINSGHIVTVTANVTIDQATIASGGTVTINGGVNLTVGAGAGDDLTIDGVLNNSGTLTSAFVFPPPPPQVGVIRVRNGGTLNNAGLISGASTSTLIFDGGATYDHQQDGGAIPTSAWSPLASPTSTCLVSGVQGTVPTGLNQNFGNFTWNCPSQSGFIDFNGTLGPNIGGNVSFLSTNGNATYLTSTSDYTLNVTGNFDVNGSYVGLNSTATTANLNVIGNFSFSNSSILDNTFGGALNLDIDGDFSIDGGTVTYNAFSLGGNVTINLAGDFTLASSPTINNDGSGTTSLFFDGASPQNYVASQAFTGFSYTVNNGSTLDVGTSEISGTGAFSLNNGATLRVGSTATDGAIQTGTTAGNIRVSGTRTYGSTSNIVYNGTALQRVGNGFPTNVNLEINNSSGVTNNNIGVTNVLGNLTLTNGSFNIGNSNTLDVQSNFIVTGGTIGGSSTSNLTFSGSGSLGTLTMTSGSQTLNDLIITRSGDLVLGSPLTIGGALSLTGNLDFASQTLTINGPSITGTGGLKSNSTSNLIIGGSGFSGLIPYNGAGNQLNDLTFNSTGGASYTWANAVTINGTVNLNFGTLTHSSGLTMATGSTLVRGAGASIISNAPGAVSNYNVSYSGNMTTGLELPAGTSTLNDLSISGDVSLDKGITINGNLLLTSGTLTTSTFNLSIAGPNFTANGGSFSSSSTTTFSRSGSTTLGGTSIAGIQFQDVTINSGATVVAPNVNINVSGAWDNNGGFTPSGGTVTFNGAAQTIASNNIAFANVVIAGSGTKTISEPLNVDNELTISSTLSVGSQDISLAGNWTNNGTFTAGTGTVNFDGTSSIAGSSSTNFGNVTITGTLNGPSTLNVAGNFTNNGTFSRGTGTVVFNGASTQSIQGTSPTTFNNINVTNVSGPPGVRVVTDQNLAGVLTLSPNVTFDADGVSGTVVFTLLSSADAPTVDGAIATIPTGASVTGNVTVQRYMSIEGGSNSPANDNGRIYRYISSPVQTPAVSQIQPEIPVTGSFTGSSSCTGCGSLQSMFAYDETVITDTNGDTFVDLNDGYIDFPATVNSETLSNGRGYTIFVRGNINPVSGAGSALWDVRAPINSGTINLNSFVSYTTSGNNPDDGWNLVGNPYPSTIDWDAASGWTRTGINNATYMLDNGLTSPVFATYISGVGLNGGSRNIPIGQAFWVKSNGGPIDFQMNENVKVAGTQSTFFKSGSIDNLLRIAVVNGAVRDESAIRFDAQAGVEFDSQLDAYKFKNPSAFNLSTLTPGGLDLAVNALPMFDCQTEVNLKLQDIQQGNYSLEFSQFESFENPTRITLIDNFLQQTFDVDTGEPYDFEVTANSETFANRFSLKFLNESVNPDLNAQASSSSSCKAGSVSLQASGAPSGGLYKWYEDQSTTSPVAEETVGLFETPILTKPKTYFVSVANAEGCEGARVAVLANVVNFNEVEITESENKLSSSYSEGNQWYKDGVLIPGATDQVYEPGESGVYKVEVNIETCTTSAERSFTVTSLEDDAFFNDFVQIFPNPVSKELTIKIRHEISGIPRIINLNGGEVGLFELNKQDDGLIGVFDFEGKAAGIYLLQVADKKGKVFNKRIVKK